MQKAALLATLAPVAVAAPALAEEVVVDTAVDTVIGAVKVSSAHQPVAGREQCRRQSAVRA